MFVTAIRERTDFLEMNICKCLWRADVGARNHPLVFQKKISSFSWQHHWKPLWEFQGTDFPSESYTHECLLSKESVPLDKHRGHRDLMSQWLLSCTFSVAYLLRICQIVYMFWNAVYIYFHLLFRLNSSARAFSNPHVKLLFIETWMFNSKLLSLSL